MKHAAAKRPGRGRRPKEDVREAIMRSAKKLLFDEGLNGFTVERVAALAGVSRVTIHRWWPSKGALAFDVYRESMEQELNISESGDVAKDIGDQLRAFVHVMTKTAAGKLLREFVGLSQLDGDLRAAFLEHYSEPRREHAVHRIRVAQRQKQIRPDVDPNTVVDQLWGACYYRLLTSDRPVTVAFADELVADLMAGISVRRKK